MAPHVPHILLICEYPTLNGGEQSLRAVLPLLMARGFEFAALAPADGPLRRAFAELGIRVLPLETHDGAGRKLSQSQIREQVATVIQRSAADVVHANSLSVGRIAGPVAAALGRPSVAHLRDIIGLSAQAVADLNRHTRLLAVSQAARDFHVAQGIAADRTFVAYNGVDVALFQSRPPTGWLHAALGLPPDTLLVGAVGQIIMRKGLDVLARAAEALAERLPNVHYVIAGERFSQKAEARAFEEHLRQVCSAGLLAGRFHFLGVCDDVPALLSELTLLAHPARQEPLGRVLLEAAAAGVPVVATDVGGTREIFGADGAALVPADDSQAMATSIARLLGDESLRHRQATAARARIEAQFMLPQAAEELARHYHEVLSAAPHAQRPQPAMHAPPVASGLPSR